MREGDIVTDDLYGLYKIYENLLNRTKEMKCRLGKAGLFYIKLVFIFVNNWMSINIGTYFICVFFLLYLFYSKKIFFLAFICIIEIGLLYICIYSLILDRMT